MVKMDRDLFYKYLLKNGQSLEQLTFVKEVLKQIIHNQ